MLDDRLGDVAVDGVDEHRARHRESGGSPRRPAGRSPGRASAGPCRRAAWPAPGTARSRARRPRRRRRRPCMAMITSLPCSSSGRNGIGGAGMTLAIVDSSSGAASAAAMNAGDDVGRRRAGSASRRRSCRPRAAGTGTGSTTPKLPPPPRIAQNRSGCVLGVHAEELAVGGHDLGGEQVVDREAVLADEVADAAAERDPADARPSRCRRTRSPGRGRRGGRGVLAGGQPGLGPGGAAFGVDVERLHVPRGRARCRRRTTPWPAALWPPLRTASSRPVSRANVTTRATSSASATRTMAAGRRSMPP